MSWETVKAFCRRQTQSLSERFRNASKTEDAESEAALSRVLLMGRVAGSTGERMEKIAAHLDAVSVLLHGIGEDFGNLGTSTGDALEASAALLVAAKKLEMTVTEMRGRCAALTQSYGETSSTLKRLAVEANQVNIFAEDRRAKMLEFDFFRNKVADLRAQPPSDPARIPRNEARLEDWHRQYDEANMKLRRFCATLTENGSRVLVSGAGVLTLELGKFFDELGRGARVVLLAQGLGDRAATAMAQATQRAVGHATAAAAGASAVAGAAATAATQQQRAGTAVSGVVAATTASTAAVSAGAFRPEPRNEFTPSAPTAAQVDGSVAGGGRRRATSHADDDPFRL